MSDTEVEVEAPPPPPTREERNRWMYDCSRCYGKFPTKQALDEHLKRRLFKCPFRCKQTFVHKDELKTHEKVCSNRLKNSSFDCYKIYNMM
ncbi:unnamed protein product [Oppiella nova]|uniref:C2H2-type domain-containing protein n=1 Tax=Oppiella nova TaxID=334625 RepID=A0A7R9LNZ5_9ACAR|nr:unnamed protein product [Oppiella nova]CAG2165543.1 unnamed protein product [Oppiella nova]